MSFAGFCLIFFFWKSYEHNKTEYYNSKSIVYWNVNCAIFTENCNSLKILQNDKIELKANNFLGYQYVNIKNEINLSFIGERFFFVILNCNWYNNGQESMKLL